MRKIKLSFTVIILILLSLSGCGKTNSPDVNNEDDNSSEEITEYNYDEGVWYGYITRYTDNDGNTQEYWSGQDVVDSRDYGDGTLNKELIEDLSYNIVFKAIEATDEYQKLNEQEKEEFREEFKQHEYEFVNFPLVINFDAEKPQVYEWFSGIVPYIVQDVEIKDKKVNNNINETYQKYFKRISRYNIDYYHKNDDGTVSITMNNGFDDDTISFTLSENELYTTQKNMKSWLRFQDRSEVINADSIKERLNVDDNQEIYFVFKREVEYSDFYLQLLDWLGKKEEANTNSTDVTEDDNNEKKEEIKRGTTYEDAINEIIEDLSAQGIYNGKEEIKYFLYDLTGDGMDEFIALAGGGMDTMLYIYTMNDGVQQMYSSAAGTSTIQGIYDGGIYSVWYRSGITREYVLKWNGSELESVDLGTSSDGSMVLSESDYETIDWYAADDLSGLY